MPLPMSSSGRLATPTPSGARPGARLAERWRRARAGLVAASVAMLVATLAACADAATEPRPMPPGGTPPGGTPPGGGTPTPTPSRADTAPPLRRELRGIWIATVGNIDWPSRTGLTAAQQQQELATLLDRAAGAGLNAVVFHVRPAADAVYPSALEPWGTMFAGTQTTTGPGWDPLEFAVREAHARGLELHAWFNPFRAGNASDTTARLASNHVFRTRRDLVRVYGAQLWMDPGEPEVHDRTMAAILDVVRRYDVDAVHLDDYFYPYQIVSAGRVVDFPDSATYARRNPNRLALADWRRDNVNRFVERLYREVHAAKPSLDVGISPFGIWRPGNPSGINGLDAYASIYADARLWLQRGWVDYLAPQLYWPIDPPAQSFTALLDWWRAPAQNPMGRHVWPGIATYRVRDSNWPVNEIARQITATRARAASAGAGLLFYNTSTTVGRDSGLVAGTLRDAFAEAALPPASPWLDQTPPPAPTLALAAPGGTTGGGAASVLRLTPGAGEAPRWWAVAQFADGAWSSPRAVWAGTRELTIPGPAASGRPDRVAVWAIDAAGNASAPVIWRGPASSAAAVAGR